MSNDIAYVIDGLKKEIQVLKRAIAALEMKSFDENGRPRLPREIWSRAQMDELSKTRIALRSELEGAEFRIRILEAANDRPRTRAERATGA